MKKIAVLGSTGSIGTQTLEIVRTNQDIKVTALAAGNNIELLEQQIREFSPKVVAVWKEERAKELKEKMELDTKVSKLKFAKANYLSQKYDLEDRIIKYYPQKIKSIKTRIEGLENDIKDLKPQKEFQQIKIKDMLIVDKKQAGNGGYISPPFSCLFLF